LCDIFNNCVIFARNYSTLFRSIVRNLFAFFILPAFYVPAASLFALTFVGCHVEAVVLLLCVTVGVNGFNYSGFTSNHIDIASNYSGTLMGITNTMGNIMGFLAPMVVSAIVEGHVSLIFMFINS